MKTKILALSLLVLSSSVAAQTVAIRAGNVIDTAKGAVAKDQIILVEDGKIKSIGSRTAVPAGAPR